MNVHLMTQTSAYARQFARMIEQEGHTLTPYDTSPNEFFARAVSTRVVELPSPLVCVVEEETPKALFASIYAHLTLSVRGDAPGKFFIFDRSQLLVRKGSCAGHNGHVRWNGLVFTHIDKLLDALRDAHRDAGLGENALSPIERCRPKRIAPDMLRCSGLMRALSDAVRVHDGSYEMVGIIDDMIVKFQLFLSPQPDRPSADDFPAELS